MREPAYVDQVARWKELLGYYPGATFSARGPWFFGALHADDPVMRSNDLKGLIDALEAREASGVSGP